MATIYASDIARIDEEVLATVKSLPDDFFVLAEFNQGRNVDWLILHPQGDAPAAMVVAELKRTSRPFRAVGGENGVWQVFEGDEWVDIRPSNDRDINPYWQAAHTANALNEWLWNNQALFLDGRDGRRPSSDFKIWPDLLILSPVGVTHQLPIRPTSRYGQWFTSLEPWVSHVLGWKPRQGLPLTAEDIQRLARALNLTRIWPTEAPTAPASAPQAFMDWLSQLMGRMEALERKVAALESRQPQQREQKAASVSQARSTSDQAPIRSLTPAEARAIVAAVESARAAGKSRALPTIIQRVNDILGENLKERGYNGFTTARALFDQARCEGIIQYGPLSGPNPTIYLPDEDPPSP